MGKFSHFSPLLGPSGEYYNHLCDSIWGHNSKLALLTEEFHFMDILGATADHMGGFLPVGILFCHYMTTDQWEKKWNAISSGPKSIPKSVLTSYGATET